MLPSDGARVIIEKPPQQIHAISTIIRDSTGLAISYRRFRSRLMSEARDNSESERVSV